jgi:hypothetical protein
MRIFMVPLVLRRGLGEGRARRKAEIGQAPAALPVEQRQQFNARDLEILRLPGEGAPRT